MWSAEEFIKALRSFDIRSGFMMRHIKSVDSQTHTILMIQVENEIAVFGEDRHINPKLWRDHSPVSNQRFAQNRFADDLTFSAWDLSIKSMKMPCKKIDSRNAAKGTARPALRIDNSPEIWGKR